MRRLEDKIALVTGGGAGIGRAIAETFAREGAFVVVADRDGEAAKEVAEAIVMANGAASSHEVDVTDTAQVKSLMQAIDETHGRLDVLVNNAGVGERADFRHLSDEAWDRVWKTNLDGTVRCAREAFDLLKASGNASVINLSSIMASKHTRQMAVYSATKGAVSALSRSLAVEYAPYGIRVNTLLPGYVETALIGRYLSNPMIAKALLDADAAQALRHAAGHRQCGAVPGVRRGGLYHRRRAQCRRRHGDHALACRARWPCAGSIMVSSTMPSTTATSAACSEPPSFFTAS